jgi:hypothetical protein
VEKARQRDIVLTLIVKPPTNVPDLITEFVYRIETYAQN